MKKKMEKKCSFRGIYFTLLLMLGIATATYNNDHGEEGGSIWDRHIKKEDRKRLVATEYGEISAVRVPADDIRASYLLHFFTLEPNSLLLPVMLHSDMVFYVHTGGGKLSWTEMDAMRTTDLKRGDVYRLRRGSVFFLQSNLETETTNNLEAANDRQKLRVHAIFTDDMSGLHGSEFRPYTNIRDLVLGFDKKVLQEAFKVSEEVIEQLFNGTETPAVIHAVSKTTTGNNLWEMEIELVRGLLSIERFNIVLDSHKKKKQKKKTTGPFNLFSEDKDFENCNGWSTMVTMKKLPDLKGLNIGLFMVNLTAGSMMGPHWNPTAAEVAVVLQGQGMIRVVCPGEAKETACRNASFKVEEGDVFVVPRFHAMAQMAFNNDTFVFMGFSTWVTYNYPQFFAGQASVLRTLSKDVLSLSFNVTNTTMDQLLASQCDSVILKCLSCAEENWEASEEEKYRKREEAREREEEASRKREEEKRKEEEEARREQEKQREEEEARKRQEEEQRKREEEEAARKRQEEEEERKRREEEERQQEEERKRQEEEEARKRQEEQERKREEEEEARKRQEEEERTGEEEEARKRQEEEERTREEEEARKRQEEEGRKREEEEAMRRREKEEERKREEEEERRKQEEPWRRAEEEARKKQEEEQKRREEEEQRGGQEQGGRRREQEEEARRTREGEEERRREQEEAREPEMIIPSAAEQGKGKGSGPEPKPEPQYNTIKQISDGR